MNKLRTVIVDDEPLARRGLSLRLADRDDLEDPLGNPTQLIKKAPAKGPS